MRRLSESVFVLPAVIILLFAFSACSRQQITQAETANQQEPAFSSGVPITAEFQQSTDVTSMEYDAYAVLNDAASTVKGTGLSFENNTLSITSAGSFYITGKLTDGRIYVNSPDTEKKVKLILDSVDISCSYDAPLFIENSPKETVIILNDGTVNSFSDTSREIPTDETDYATAAIYSKDDLQIEGAGELIVTGNFGKGVFSKNDIDIRGGVISITAVDDGIRGKDSVEAENCTLNITSGGDGIRTSEELEADKGDITVNSGNINITSSLDGIQATGNVYLNGGSISVTSAGGTTGDYSYQAQGWGSPFPGGGRGGFLFAQGGTPDGSLAEEESSDTPSTKGIKAGKSITVSAGVLTLNCLDDCIHAPYVTVNDGTVTASSDDDGIHADENVTVNGGYIDIKTSYEGVEGRTVNINGGTLVAKSADDGFNAASSSVSTYADITQTAMGGFGGMMDYDSSCMITVTDGYVLVDASGDGIDSNGSVELKGGTMIVFGPTNAGNGALDYGGSFVVNGGTLLATGALGMAQSVTGNGVDVLNFNISGNGNTLYAIADSQSGCAIAFTAPKQFENVIFASDVLDSGKSYSVYQNGNVTGSTPDANGVIFGGAYTPGELIATLS